MIKGVKVTDEEINKLMKQIQEQQNDKSKRKEEENINDIMNDIEKEFQELDDILKDVNLNGGDEFSPLYAPGD